MRVSAASGGAQLAGRGADEAEAVAVDGPVVQCRAERGCVQLAEMVLDDQQRVPNERRGVLDPVASLRC